MSLYFINEGDQIGLICHFHFTVKCIEYLLILFFYLGHKNWVLCIAWSPDGKHLVSGSKSGELLLWDPQTGKQSGSPFTVNSK